MSQATELTLNDGALRLQLVGDEGGVLRVQCEGAVDLPGFRDTEDPLVRLLGPEVYHRNVLLDMERTTALDTTAVGWLVNSHKRFRDAGGRLVLYGLPPGGLSVLRLLQLDRVLDVAGDLPAAQAALGGKSK